MTPSTTGFDLRRCLAFVGVAALAHVVTYLVAGTVAYFLIYEAQMEAGVFDPLTLMRNPNNPDEWRHVETWLFLAQALRGVLFGVTLLPFVAALAQRAFLGRFITLLILLLTFSVWSVTMPGPGSIEGWLYLKPNSGPNLPNSLLGYIEVPAQLAVFSAVVSWWIGKHKAGWAK